MLSPRPWSMTMRARESFSAAGMNSLWSILILRSGGLQFFPLGIAPVHELLALGVSEPRFGMHQRVIFRRHFVVVENLIDAIQFFGDSGGVGRPIGKIKVLAAFVHVADDQPRGRRDARIQRPFSFIGMTVVAGDAEQGGDFLRW